MRARLALLLSGLSIEIREISLKNKPSDMLSVSPKGTVPVLLLADGSVIDESWDIMRWSLSNHCEVDWASANDENIMRTTQSLVDENDNIFKPQLDRYKYAVGYPEFPMEHYRSQGENFLALLNDQLAAQPYLASRHLSMADLAIAPFIRQFAHVDKNWFYQTPYINLHHWLDSIVNSEPFLTVMEKFPLWEPKADPVIFPSGNTLKT